MLRRAVSLKVVFEVATDAAREQARRRERRASIKAARKVRADASNKLRARVIEAITTNETSFFRDTSPFELLKQKLIPEIVAQRVEQRHVGIDIDRVVAAVDVEGDFLRHRGSFPRTNMARTLVEPRHDENRY